ncbi:hypothetical protein A9F13_17g00418 [Clavispora lusitaniae]|uniref:RING finger protein n=1 Tax=Clavispora lusitaniae TaxID=36911 RepID=A0AA91T075_CLALS|nr:hypothetical protein A9F13_17g00418 [Clavispora lusitaniae]
MIGTDSYRISIELNTNQSQQSESEHSGDYRHSPISVTVIDNPMENLAPYQNPPEPLKARSLGNGVIRLFRDFEDSEQCDPLRSDPLSNEGDDTMLSIIALPTYFTATDLLGYIGDYYMEYVTHIRILKSQKPNRFLVLIKFKDLVKAAEFQYHYDGKQFNSMEPETCHVVFVKSVVFEPESQESGENDMLIPFLLRDPFTSSATSSPSSSSPSAFEDEANPIELPTCPVCLERLDYEITGLLTIPCQHTFHCSCLSKWKDDTCPVCRYTNNVSNLKIRRSVRRLSQINSRMQQQQQLSQQQMPENTSEVTEQCMSCSASTNLWVCLVCGNVGCSRYAPEQHSLKHFVETGHCFAMELTTSRVWDYAGDNYVHRLIANEADGKIVELPEKDSSEESKSKSESAGLEYSDLLMSQLISQKEYYELLLNEKDRTGELRSRRGSSIAEGKRVSELEEKVAELSEKFTKLTTNVVPALKQKIDMKDTSLRIAAKELSELNALNEGLSNKVEYLTKENAELKAQNEDLSEQVKDLMFYLESQEKFKDQPEEVREGTIVMQPAKGKKKKGKR